MLKLIFIRLTTSQAEGQENKYKYNGKEESGEFGLKWLSFEARWYDAAIGRFTGVDPIADQFPHLSAFNYAGNGPISNIDLHGLQQFQKIEEPSDLVSKKQVDNFVEAMKVYANHLKETFTPSGDGDVSEGYLLSGGDFSGGNDKGYTKDAEEADIGELLQGTPGTQQLKRVSKGLKMIDQFLDANSGMKDIVRDLPDVTNKAVDFTRELKNTVDKLERDTTEIRVNEHYTLTKTMPSKENSQQE